MNRLNHYAEPFPATGGMASEGVKNQLGRPRMPPLEVLVREAVQNCWDAKAPDSTQVAVDFSLIELSGMSRDVARKVVFGDVPDDGSEDSPAAGSSMLVISDRGTTGLGGVLRADEADGEEPRDFVDFLRNIGQPPDTELGGGTYGFGKVALYAASRASTIIAYTRCRFEGRLQSRLLAARLGQQYQAGGRRFTGRHWWGRLVDGIIDPVLDSEADEIAKGLGIRGFDDDQCGTSIAIVDPRFVFEAEQEGMTQIVEAILWNFWPKLMGSSGEEPPMRILVSRRGQAIPLPEIPAHPVLGGFHTAYTALKDTLGSGEHISRPGIRTQDLACQRPRRDLGSLALATFPAVRRAEADDEAALIPGSTSRRVHHVALLRFPELVVKYEECPEHPTPGINYAGVFLARQDMDRVFAESEPPTHDDWIPDGLTDRHHRTFVRVTFRRINEATSAFTGLHRSDVGGRAGSSLAAVARRLSGLLPGIDGPDGAVQPSRSRGDGGRGGGGAKGRRPSIAIEGSPELSVFRGHPSMTVRARLSVPDDCEGAVVRAQPFVLLEDGGREREAPAAGHRMEVLAWRLRGREVGAHEARILVDGTGEFRP